MRKALLFISLFFLSLGEMFAADLPFTDISSNDTFYSAVKKLYDGGIISKTSDGLFRPNELMNRDFYVSLTVGVGCKKCAIPDQSDIVRYNISPFTDLPKTNEYYYCIAYAADKNITEGYILDQTGQAKCEDGQSYSTQPFCAANTITRIEAAAILLRRGNLWSETLNNGNFDRTLTIPDASTYWYGYAKKGIEYGIISQKSDSTIGQNDKITRAEFSMMAAKILEYTQCNLDTDNDNSMEGAIGITTGSGLTRRTSFAEDEAFTLVPITSPGNWNYFWKAINPITGQVVTYSGKNMEGNLLSSGNWMVDLSIIDPTTNEVRSNPKITLQIGTSGNSIYDGNIRIRDTSGTIRNESVFSVTEEITIFHQENATTGDSVWKFVERNTGKTLNFTSKEVDGSLLGIGQWQISLTTLDPTTKQVVDFDQRDIHIIGSSLPPSTNNGTNLSVGIEATPLKALLGENINFTSIVSGGSTNNTYSWDFGNGEKSTDKNTTYTYTIPGIYTVTLTIKDPATGNERQASVIISVSGESDTDGDGILDSKDFCKGIVGLAGNNGCPIFATVDYQVDVGSILGGDGTNGGDRRDTDNDGTINRNDTCPLVYGPPSNQGCPLGEDGDRDGDTVKDADDRCIRVPGSITNAGCPEDSITDSITQNACILGKMNNQGMMMASPVCATCPCDNSIKILSSLRPCDVVFPTILSPDEESIYSRGGFFVVP